MGGSEGADIYVTIGDAWLPDPTHRSGLSPHCSVLGQEMGWQAIAAWDHLLIKIPHVLNVIPSH